MIEVKNLSFTYIRGQQPAVRSVDFEIEAGEVFGLLGPNGAGKTTIQNILIGILKGFQGRVSVMGRELAGWGRDYYESIGVSFEFPNHYLKLTARENLEYFRALYSGETEKPADLLRLVGLEGDIDVPVGQFSKGMKNRLNFARSLLHRPRLWFLDEPTTGLDPANSKNIRNIVKERQSRGSTTFLTTHDMMVADELCDRVGFIVDGELKIVDAPGTLKRRYGSPTVKVEVASDEGIETREFPLDGLGEDQGFLGTIREQRVETIHSQEATLEEVFLEVTGRGARVRRLAATLRLDVQVQSRNLLYHIGVGVALAVGLAARYFLDPEVIRVLLPVFFLGALLGTTYMFVAAMVLFEKGERTLDAVIVSPLPTRESILSKVLTLTGFGLVESIIVLLLAYGFADFHVVPLLAGVLVMGALYALVGTAQVVRYDSVTEFLIPGAILTGMVLQLPFLHALDIWPSPIWYLVPTQAPLLLMKGAFQPIADWEWIYAVGYSFVALVAGYRLAESEFTKYIVRGGR